MEYIANGSEVYSETRLIYKYVCMPLINWFLVFKCLKSGWGKLTADVYFQIYEY